MGLATTFVLTLTSASSYLVYEFLLVPFQLEWLRTIAFILIIAILVQFTEIMVRATSPLLHSMLGIFLPLITTNCAVLGLALLNSQRSDGFLAALVSGAGAALGFTLVLTLFSAIREKLAQADVPAPFRGSPVALLTAGLMSLAFMGFAGLVRP